MKIFVISDNVDTFTGMRLVGIEGVVAHERDEFKAAVDRVLGDESIGILLVMEKQAQKFSDIVDEIKLSRSLPLVVEIPDRHGSARSDDFITSYIKNAIGVS